MTKEEYDDLTPGQKKIFDRLQESLDDLKKNWDNVDKAITYFQMKDADPNLN